MTRKPPHESRSDARSVLLLALAIVPILVTGWFSYNQWADANRQLSEINAARKPLAAAYHGYEIFDRLSRSQLLIEAMALPDPPAAVEEMIRRDQATVADDLDGAVQAFDPYLATFAAQIGQTEELAANLVDTAMGFPRAAILEYEIGDTPPVLLDLVLRPGRDGLHDMAPVLVSSASPEDRLLGALMILDHDHHDDLLDALRGRLGRNSMRLADLRLPVWSPEDRAWSLDLQRLPDDANLVDLAEFGSLASESNPLAPPLLALVEAGTNPSPTRDEVLVAGLVNDLALNEARTEAFDAYMVTADARSAELRRARLLAIAAGIAMTGLAIGLLRLVIAEVAERRWVAHAHSKTLAETAELANRDALTGLRNRRWLDGALPKILERCGPEERVLVVYLDLDRFKAINDVWGHHNGDRILAAVAQRLLAVADDQGGLELVRFGGDEFVGINTVSSTISDRALQACGVALAGAFDDPVTVAGRDHEIKTSVGIALSSDDSSAHSLLVDADFAMLRAKHGGRGRVALAHEGAQGAAKLVQRIPDALAAGEFRAYLQPVVSPASGAVQHYEALARWTRPNGEEVPPDVFVPLVETFGLADDLTAAMLANVADLHRRFGADIPRIWVNVAPAEFNGPDLSKRMLARLAELELPPTAIGIEMTERSAIGDLVGVEDELQQLRSEGIKIAIDDFGAGYSPLGHLRHLPVDILKIDRALVSGIDQDEGTRNIVRGIIGFARSLGLELVAEGVETEAERRVLTEEGVDLVQGWLTGHPGPAQAVLEATWHSARSAQASEQDERLAANGVAT